jgi:short-subunit dehydrogenase
MNVLITGSTSGIGEVIAKYLLENQYSVIGTSRNPDGVKNKTNYPLLKLDITSKASIDSCIVELETKGILIDVLINNAGIGICGSVEETPDDLAREQLETNFWGAVNLTKAILPKMRENKKGKIIFITSLAGLIGIPYQGFYSASKHALEGFCKSLRHEVKEFNISVSSIEPGFFKTNLHNSFKYADATIEDYSESRENVLDVFIDSIENAPKPDKIAKTVLHIIKTKKPKYSYRVGKDAKILPILQFLFYSLFEKGTRNKFKLPK